MNHKIQGQYVEDISTGFAMFCDTNNLSYKEGIKLADDLIDELAYIAEERKMDSRVRRELEEE